MKPRYVLAPEAVLDLVSGDISGNKAALRWLTVLKRLFSAGLASWQARPTPDIGVRT
jgi:hypothetical protein